MSTNKNSYQYIGQKFRKLRKERGITLNQLTKHVNISRQTLGNWEIGVGDLRLTDFLQLLDTLKIDPIEFIELNVAPFNFITQISKLYITNNISGLKSKCSNLLDQFRNNPTDKSLFLKSMIVCNFYYDLTNYDLSSSKDKQRLNNFFRSLIDEDRGWVLNDIYIFGDTTNLLDPRTIYLLAYSLLNDYSNKSKLSKEWISSTLNTLLNAEFALIKKKDPHRAEKLDQKIKTINISDLYASEKLRKNFIHSLLSYIKSNDNEELCATIDFLKKQNFYDLSEGFSFALKQVEDIYFNPKT